MAVRRTLAPLVLLLALILAGPAAGAAGPTTRTHLVSLSAPAQFDFTLAEIRFPVATGRPLRLALAGTPGLYYAAGALVRHPPPGGPRALVVVVNRRPRGSLAPDLARIGLRVTAARRYGAPSIRAAVNPFARPVGGRMPSLCAGRPAGGSLAAGSVQKLFTAGPGLAGFDGAATVAQAYDVACGLSFDPAFATAVRGPCGTSLVAGCCPPNALCVAPPNPTPPPVPPTPAPGPVCPPCPPLPCAAVACPLGRSAPARAIACPLVGPAPAC